MLSAISKKTTTSIFCSKLRHLRTRSFACCYFGLTQSKTSFSITQIISKKINPKSEKMKIFTFLFQLALSQEMSLIENQEMLPCPTKNDPNLMCSGWNLKFPGLILCAYIPETVYFSAKSNFHFNKGQDFQPGFNCMNVSNYLIFK